MYTAMKMSSPGRQISGFETKDEAWEYIFSQMCDTCQNDRKRYLENPNQLLQSDDYISAYPACSAEWLVGLTSEMLDAETLDEIMIAGGFVEVYNNGKLTEPGIVPSC